MYGIFTYIWLIFMVNNSNMDPMGTVDEDIPIHQLKTARNFSVELFTRGLIHLIPGMKQTWKARKTHHKFQVPKMEILNLIRLFLGLGFVFPYISRIHTAYIGEYLHFSYLKCLVIRLPKFGFDDSFPTSRAARGGGGSFKNRKRIGEIGYCESRMTKRKHRWIWLTADLSNWLTD